MKLCERRRRGSRRHGGEIKALNPKPALAYEHRRGAPVTRHPGARSLTKLEWSSRTRVVPRVLVNNAYYARVAGQARGKNDRDYIIESSTRPTGW